MNVELLVAGTAGPVGAAGRARESTGWQQQLQRAQAAGWFRRADRLPGGESSPDRPLVPALERPVGGGRQSGVGSRAALPPPPHWPIAASTIHGFAAPSIPLVEPSHADWVAAIQAALLRVEAPSNGAKGEAPAAARLDGKEPEATDTVELRPTARLGAEADEAPAIRVHIEDGPQGLRFWLGLDGTAADVEVRASAVATELRRQCERAGLRLANLTCNGVPVAGDAPVSSRSREEP